jgi:hypothetical protein
MTIDLSETAPERTDRFAVLVDTRPDAKNNRRGLILRHPYWATMKGESDPPLYYADAVVKWADISAKSDEIVPFEAGKEYTDPVSQPTDGKDGISEYSGTWLASANRVRVGPEKIDTGWVVVVQERRDATLQPVRNLQWRLGYVALAATIIVLVLMALMWGGMIVVMDPTTRSPITRLLRRWAGLPTSSTVGTIGAPGTVGSSLPAAITARGTGTPTPGQGERG